MTAFVLFIVFAFLMILGVPVSASLGIGGLLAIALDNPDSRWFGLIAGGQNALAGVSKFPLLALPMFVLVGVIFERSGVASRIVNFATACVGRGPGMLPTVAILVAIAMGGISGSAVAGAAAVGGVMIGPMIRAGYKPAFSASVVGAATSVEILVPPSIALIVYSISVPGASVPAMFAAGILPGFLAGIALIVPAILVSRRHGFGRDEHMLDRPPFWSSLREASWGLATPIVILGGMRAGIFTPTEAAVVAVILGLFIGLVVYRTIAMRDLPGLFSDAAETSAVIMIVIALASIFAYSVTTIGMAEPIVQAITDLGWGRIATLLAVMAMLLLIGVVLDGVSIFLIFLPLMVPLMQIFDWDPVWFGILITMAISIGTFTPPMAVNLLVTSRIAGISVEETVPWVGWLVTSFAVAALLVVFVPGLATWLPQYFQY
ncbi:MAG: TRAP transporter large permease [Rhizobiaceae bacterium]